MNSVNIFNDANFCKHTGPSGVESNPESYIPPVFKYLKINKKNKLLSSLGKTDPLLSLQIGPSKTSVPGLATFIKLPPTLCSLLR